MYQKLIIAGNLGNDPIMRYIADGTPVTTLSVAVNDGDKTAWFRVSVWRKAAEACNQYLHKGSSVLVEGSLSFDESTGGPRMWDGKDGQPRASFEVNATRVKFLSGKREDGAPESDDNVPF